LIEDLFSWREHFRTKNRGEDLWREVEEAEAEQKAAITKSAED
jgi:hypothetical protein